MKSFVQFASCIFLLYLCLLYLITALFIYIYIYIYIYMTFNFFYLLYSIFECPMILKYRCLGFHIRIVVFFFQSQNSDPFLSQCGFIFRFYNIFLSTLNIIYNVINYGLCMISSSHCGEYEAQNLLGCTVLFLIECPPTFQRYLRPPSSGRLWRQHVPLKRRSTFN
jgi:hypothetical protein